METREYTITVDEEELAIIMAAMTHYRMAAFPLGRSSFSNPISLQDRHQWRVLGMNLWKKLNTIKKGV